MTPAGLKQRMLRAGGWSMAGYALGQALRLGSNLVMTRLLIPEMFGVMAIATMVSVILWLLSDLGVHQNIVQSRRDDADFLDTAWAVQVVRGVVLWLLALLLSAGLHFARLEGLLPPDSVYAAPVLPAVIAVSAFSAVLLGCESTKMSTAHRRLEQKRVNLIAVLGQVAALAVMIPLALWTRSIWALVAGGLVASLTSLILSHAWMSGHRNRFRWERTALAELLGFGKWVALSSLLSVLATSGDRLLLGFFMDAHLLGLYSIAALMIGALEGALGRLFMAVGLPALSEIARTTPERLREAYRRIRVPTDIALFIAAGALFAAGQLVIDVLYDHRYAAAGAMLQVLAVSLFFVRYRIAHQMYLALGLPRYLTMVNIVRCASLYALVPALYWHGGPMAAIWGISLHALATVPLIYLLNGRHGLNDWRSELATLPALAGGYGLGMLAMHLAR